MVSPKAIRGALYPFLAGGVALVVIGLVPAMAGAAKEEAPPACSELPEYSTLDFWLGEWDVYLGDRKVGTNRIDKILDGCAVLEHWTSSEGGTGKSLFYFVPAESTWKQVWVTDRATVPGGLKEKVLVETLEGGGVRFQGEISVPGRGTYLDRTTLRPLPGGEVSQRIALSKDGGTTWETGFDAIYRREGSDPPDGGGDSSGDEETAQ